VAEDTDRSAISLLDERLICEFRPSTTSTCSFSRLKLCNCCSADLNRVRRPEESAGHEQGEVQVGEAGKRRSATRRKTNTTRHTLQHIPPHVRKMAEEYKARTQPTISKPNAT